MMAGMTNELTNALPQGKLPQLPLHGAGGPLVSALGLGTVKWGRNQGVKYPAFELPTHEAIHQLLDAAAAGGVNCLDTAPAYGIAEERVGQVLAERPNHGFLVLTKTGESFAQGESVFDFSRQGTEASLRRSLQRLRTERLDAVQVHCPPADLQALKETPVLDVLQEWQARGDIGSVGVSTMTVEGGLWAAERVDFLMVPFSIGYQAHRSVVEKAGRLGKGVLVKRALYSGPALAEGRSLHEHLAAVYCVPGVTSVVAGTLSIGHLEENIAEVVRILA